MIYKYRNEHNKKHSSIDYVFYISNDDNRFYVGRKRDVAKYRIRLIEE